MAGFTPYTYHPSDHHGQDSTHTDDATASKAGKVAAAHTDDGQNSSVLAAKAAKAATVDNQQQSTLASKVAATR